ncbi:MAG: PilZ domain-containing protein [Hyphomicrobiaceae bacterium]|nr:PilZ domain-containing protein [Hyphomicrobiaceae bacterium]
MSDIERHQQEFSQARNAIKTPKGFFAKLKPGGAQKVITRRFQRYDCCIVGEMTIVDRAYVLEGTLMEISQGGILFRGASAHILDRSNQRVRIAFEDLELTGKIMATRPQGYGIKLDEDLDLTAVASLVDQYGLDELAA